MSLRFKTIDNTAWVPHAFCTTYTRQLIAQITAKNLLSEENMLRQIIIDHSSVHNMGTLVLGRSIFEQEHNPVDFATLPVS